jgi:hypothetical protein
MEGAISNAVHHRVTGSWGEASRGNIGLEESLRLHPNNNVIQENPSIANFQSCQRT